jgi:hypothetical protein
VHQRRAQQREQQASQAAAAAEAASWAPVGAAAAEHEQWGAGAWRDAGAADVTDQSVDARAGLAAAIETQPSAASSSGAGAMVAVAAASGSGYDAFKLDRQAAAREPWLRQREPWWLARIQRELQDTHVTKLPIRDPPKAEPQ